MDWNRVIDLAEVYIWFVVASGGFGLLMSVIFFIFVMRRFALHGQEMKEMRKRHREFRDRMHVNRLDRY